MTLSINRNSMVFIGFLATLILCNVHLFTNQLPQALIYRHNMVHAGQWWRIITYPLVHISWYHLILDAAATLILWHEIKHLSLPAKLLLTSYLSMTVLLISILWSPDIGATGLCGLSGIAHGLALFAGLSQIHMAIKGPAFQKNLLISGLLLSGVITTKCIYEMVTGEVIFNSIHLGELGTPIVHAHLGGAVGGLTAFFAWQAVTSLHNKRIKLIRGGTFF